MSCAGKPAFLPQCWFPAALRVPHHGSGHPLPPAGTFISSLTKRQAVLEPLKPTFFHARDQTRCVKPVSGPFRVESGPCDLCWCWGGVPAQFQRGEKHPPHQCFSKLSAVLFFIPDTQHTVICKAFWQLQPSSLRHVTFCSVYTGCQ